MKNWGVIAIIAASLIVLLGQYPIHSDSTSSPVLQAEENAVTPRTGAPVRILIPSININAQVEHVSTTSDGLMDVPKHQFNTAWYAPGTRPGEVGSAVIAGHVDWELGDKAAFTNLRDLKPGDKIIIQNEHGVNISFSVRTSRVYDSEDDALDVFISTDGLAHLNLVTCQGPWNEASETYSQRLVVFTDKEK